MSKNILVPVDGSEHSKKALEFACELANKFDGKLHLVHVAQALHQDKTLVLGAAAVTIHASREELEKVGRKVIDAAKQLAAHHGCGDVGAEVMTGDPAKMILKAATDQKADMIVMGSRGLSDISGLMFGSVSHKVNHLAPCTCISVR
jgi:nucleotide-binding universal stress UspA family protein